MDSSKSSKGFSAIETLEDVLHFTDSDFVEEHTDSNPRRKRKCFSSKLNKRYLKKDAVPSIFPNAPSYLTTPLTTPRASAETVTSSGRRQQDKRRLNTLLELFEAQDNVQSMIPSQINDKLSAESPVPGGFQILVMDGNLVIYWLRLIDSTPDILASITKDG
jgi:hypothetical protein